MNGTAMAESIDIYEDVTKRSRAIPATIPSQLGGPPLTVGKQYSRVYNMPTDRMEIVPMEGTVVPWESKNGDVQHDMLRPIVKQVLEGQITQHPTTGRTTKRITLVIVKIEPFQEEK